MRKLLGGRERYAPWILLAGMLAAAFLSWRLHSAFAGTAIGVLLVVTLLPATSPARGGLVGGMIGAMAGAISEAVLFSVERGGGRIFVATAYGFLLGALWGVVVALVARLRHRRAGPPTHGSGASRRPPTPPGSR